VTISTSTFPIPQARRASAPQRPVAIWLLVCCAMIFLMVVIGGITRLTESGLSITEWKPVIGAVPPMSDQEWQAEFEHYKQIPEYRERNAGMTLGQYKHIVWGEDGHRLWGRLIGLAYLVPLLGFLATGRVRGKLAWRLSGIFVLGALQGALGWYMVKSGLIDRVDVSPYRLTAHLGLALLIFAATLWTALDLLRPPSSGIRGAVLRTDRRALALAWFVFLTMMAGGLVAGTDAGFVYNTFPLMDGRWIPAGYLDLVPWWLNPFANVAAIQFDHRVLGISTVVLALLYWWRARRNAADGTVHLVLGMALLQAALGISTLLLVVPIPLAATHQAGAVTLFTLALVAAQAGRRRK
jgi:cytochrome c oxidase assembly protein subunit 15